MAKNLPLSQWLKSTKVRAFKKGSLHMEEIVFDVAAKRGHLDTVQWVVQALTEKAWPLPGAVFGGHLDTVK